jgi:cell division protein FtsB
MIILATFALCVTITVRTGAKMRVASEQYAHIQNDIETLRRSNQGLEVEIQRLRNDPRAIELAARSRLNMVRANEIMVPIE